MNSHVARQPILDTEAQTVAYELLFRSSAVAESFGANDPDVAAKRVVHDSILVFDWKTLTGGRRAFVNLTRSALLSGAARLLPADQTAVEILESVEPDEAVVRAVVELKNAGYPIALDDFVPAPKWAPLLAVADYVKIDFLAMKDPEERASVARTLIPRGIKLVAEKVETREEFAQARQLGYALFQGFYFCRPQTLSARDVPASKISCVHLLAELNAADVGFERIEGIIKRDVALTVKLLRYLNSAAFGFRNPISSVRQGLSLLGERALRHWASIVGLTSLGEGKPSELVKICLARALFLESLAPKAGLGRYAQDVFLLGLLSAVDALVGRPMAELLTSMSVAPNVRSALLGQPSPLDPLWTLVTSWERGNFQDSEAYADVLGVPLPLVAEAYQSAVAAAEQAYRHAQ
ncbi:MAG: HDOD domain-containing protein [Myxococcales bacterium]